MLSPSGQKPNSNPFATALPDAKQPITRSYRPRGVMSIEIIAHIGDAAPVSMSQYQPLGVATRMIHPITFAVEAGGKSIWYRFRWIGTRGEVGSWSDSFSATIWK